MSYQDICKGLKKEAEMKKEALFPKGKALQAEKFLRALLKGTTFPEGKTAFRNGLMGFKGESNIQGIGKLIFDTAQRDPQVAFGNGRVADKIGDLLLRARSDIGPGWYVPPERFGFGSQFLRPLKDTGFTDRINRLFARLIRRVGAPDLYKQTAETAKDALHEHLTGVGRFTQTLSGKLRPSLSSKNMSDLLNML